MTGGTNQWSEYATAGRIVARDPAAIADAVRGLLTDPPDRDAVAATVERFSWPAHADELATLYNEVAERDAEEDENGQNPGN